jgi:hypothetical protein
MVPAFHNTAARHPLHPDLTHESISWPIALAIDLLKNRLIGTPQTSSLPGPDRPGEWVDLPDFLYAKPSQLPICIPGGTFFDAFLYHRAICLGLDFPVFREMAGRCADWFTSDAERIGVRHVWIEGLDGDR